MGGIDTYGDISITAECVNVVTQRYSCLEGVNVYIDCDDLHIENRLVEVSEK